MNISNLIRFIKSIKVITFLKLNYFSKNIIREDGSKIIPYKNSVVDISPSSRIILSGGDIEIGCDLLRGSRAETRVRTHADSIWKSKNGCKVSYGCTIELLEKSVFDNKFFTMNVNSVLVVAKNICFGQDVMIGRNAVIYDSDFHSIIDNESNTRNPSRPVNIGDHVWIGTNTIVLKGTIIESNSIVSAGTIVNGKTNVNTIISSNIENKEKELSKTWIRQSPN